MALATGGVGHHKGRPMIIGAADRAIDIYGALSGRAEVLGVRADLTKHLDELYAEGETDRHRLTVHGLTFLRKHDAERSR